MAMVVRTPDPTGEGSRSSSSSHNLLLVMLLVLLLVLTVNDANTDAQMRRGHRVESEVGGDVGEPVEVDAAGAFRVLLVDQVLQLALVEQLAHRVEDGRDLDRLDKASLLRVKHLECLAHDQHSLLLIILWSGM
uniref:Uncharacterized protein n=1 Tax=Anopheles farauti TaxID=69004 RepID=A0A182QKM1_9DIPT